MRYGSLIAGLFAGMVLGSRLSEAQYTADFQTNIISGVTSNWTGDYIVGNTNSGDALLIQNGGSLTNQAGTIGNAAGAAKNTVVVSGINSLWGNTGTLTVGASGSDNQLSITNAGNVTASNLLISANAGATNNLVFVNGGDLTATNLTAGDAGTGQLLVSNGMVMVGQMFIASNQFSLGTLTIAGGSVLTSNLTVGAATNAAGVIAMTGGQLIVTNLMTIGSFGTGSMSVTNASVQCRGPSFFAGVIVGRHSGSSGTLTISDGIFSVTQGSLLAGFQANSTGTLWLVGGALIATNGDVDIGYPSGTGNMTISNGLLQADYVSVGNGDPLGRLGSLRLINGTISLAHSLHVGRIGTGTCWVVGGQIIATNDWSSVGISPSTGQMIVSNGTVLFRDMVIGDSISLNGPNGPGTLTLAGGQMRIISNLLIGYATDLPSTAYASGSVWVTGGQLSASDGTVVVGHGGAGQLVVSNGTLTARDLFVAASTNGVGRLTVAGGTTTALGSLVVGDCTLGATGSVLVSGGNLYVTNTAHNAVLDVASGTVILSSGLLRADIIIMTNVCAQFVRTGGTLIYGIAVLDPNRDDDGDGIPNGWEQSHGLDPLNAADANVDSDGDGFTNLQEYMAGTDPTNSASAFRINSVVRTSNDMLITWITGIGKTNALQRSSGSTGSFSNNFTDIFTVTNTTGTVANYLDIGAATNVPSLFYRVRLVP